MEPQSLFSVAMQERPIKSVDPTAERNLSEQIAEQIGERIIRGQLPAGTRLLEVRLAEELKVSRGPIREALRVLEKRRLVRILSRRGAVVTDLSPADIVCLYDVIVPLYELLTRKTAENWTPTDLHPLYTVIERLSEAAKGGNVEDYYENNFAFARACSPIANNSLLANMLSDLEPGLRRVLYLSWEHRSQEMERHFSLLRQLIRLVTEREGLAAARVIHELGELEKRLALESCGTGDTTSPRRHQTTRTPER
jgi:DNA-binding GntR family transcriptional regulator